MKAALTLALIKTNWRYADFTLSSEIAIALRRLHVVEATATWSKGVLTGGRGNADISYGTKNSPIYRRVDHTLKQRTNKKSLFDCTSKQTEETLGRVRFSMPTDMLSLSCNSKIQSNSSSKMKNTRNV